MILRGKHLGVLVVRENVLSTNIATDTLEYRLVYGAEAAYTVDRRLWLESKDGVVDN